MTNKVSKEVLSILKSIELRDLRMCEVYVDVKDRKVKMLCIGISKQDHCKFCEAIKTLEGRCEDE